MHHYFTIPFLVLIACITFGVNTAGNGGKSNETAELCSRPEICSGSGRALSGAFSLLDVGQGLICALASLVAATSVMLLLLFVLLSRLMTVARH